MRWIAKSACKLVRACFASWLALGASTVSWAAEALSPIARQLYSEGERDYQAGRYENAVRAFERAYALSSAPAVLYALGQAERKKGDCKAAVDHFKRFLDSAPKRSARDAARFQMVRCLEQLGTSATVAGGAVSPAVEHEVP